MIADSADRAIRAASPWRFWLLPLLMAVQVSLGCSSWQQPQGLGSGIADLLAVPLLIGVLVLRSSQLITLALSSGAWFVALALKDLWISDWTPERASIWIGFRLFAVAICIVYSLRQELLQATNTLLASILHPPLTRAGFKQCRDASLASDTSRREHALQASLHSGALVHELRQPLAQLLLQTRQLQLAQDASALQLQLEDLLITAEEINGTVTSIEALLRSTHPRDPQPVDLSRLVHESLDRWREALITHGIQLNGRFIQTSLVVKGDRRQLQIAIDKLLSNATDALQMNKPGDRVLQVSLTGRGRHVELGVADNGPGLPSHDLEMLQLRSNKEGGLGLGLTIVQLVARHHQGSLSMGRSSSLGGADFKLNLQLAAPDAQPAGNDAGRPDAPARHH